MNKYTILIFLMLILSCKQPIAQTIKIVTNKTKEVEKTTESIVFIAGFDKGDNSYYNNAKNYFKTQKVKVIEHLYSISEIINYLNTDSAKVYDKIHIVNHSNPWMGMSLTTTKEGSRITLETLSKAKEENEIPSLNYGITNNTKIIFHSCGLGENKPLLKELKQFFKTNETPKIIASPFFNVFGGKYARHYLAKPYYGYYPTAESPGPNAISKEFKTTYPTTKIDWSTALKTRKEAAFGEVYSYKFNIPFDWEFTFDDTADIPTLHDKEDIMDWISESSEMATVLYKLNIPIEKYRWRSSIKGNQLQIKGKATVICVLAPVLQENDPTEYKSITFNDANLYHVL